MCLHLAAFAALTVNAAAREWPDAGGEHEYARLDWDLIERDIRGWSKLPRLTREESANEAACVLPDDKDPLDVLARRELWHFIEGLKGKMTIILTTHYLEEAESLCDRIGVMAHGELCAEGTAEELKAKAGTDDFEEAFIRIAGEGVK